MRSRDSGLRRRVGGYHLNIRGKGLSRGESCLEIANNANSGESGGEGKKDAGGRSKKTSGLAQEVMDLERTCVSSMHIQLKQTITHIKGNSMHAIKKVPSPQLL